MNYRDCEECDYYERELQELEIDEDDIKGYRLERDWDIHLQQVHGDFGEEG